MEISVKDLAKHFEAFIDATDEARLRSERARDYRDGKQWTEEEAAKLMARGQAPIVINRIAPKVDALLGIERQTRTDPKAYPRNPQDEQASEAATDALRYVEDNTDFDMIASDVFEQVIVEGYSGSITEIEETPRGPEIVIHHIDYDRLYFDPHSRRKDFKDARYMGIVMWMDKDEAEQEFPKKKDVIGKAFVSTGSAGLETFDDKPLWIDRERKRIRVCQHYFEHEGVWKLAFFTQEDFLLEPIDSPYLDEFDVPMCPIELECAYIDRENNRYGIVHNLLDIQDEVNHRRSKGLHLLSVRQTMSTHGAVDDIQAMKYELSKADGHVEINGEITENFQVLNTGDMATAQFSLLQEAKSEIDAVGVNAALSGTEERNLSGRALQARQQAGMNELGPLFDQHRHFKKRVYRQIWFRIKQFWTEEKWIRVTDNQNSMKFVGLNTPVPVGAALQQQAQQGDERAAFALNSLMQTQDPRLNEVARIENNVTELDMDILLETGPDSVTIQQEQFEALTQLAQVYGPQFVPFDAIVEASSLRNKQELLDKLKGDPEQQQAAAQAAQQAAQLEQAMKSAELEKTLAEAEKAGAEADQKNLETELLMAAPTPVTSVAI